MSSITLPNANAYLLPSVPILPSTAAAKNTVESATILDPSVPALPSITAAVESALIEPKKSRASNWTILEDTALAKAYAHVTVDSITGVDQKLDVFYGNVYNVFSEVWVSDKLDRIYGPITTRDGRTAKHLGTRMKTLIKIIQSFVGCYNSIKQLRTGNVNEDDLFRAACTLFVSKEENDRKQFLHRDAWDILKSLPKFTAPVDTNVVTVLDNEEDGEKKALPNSYDATASALVPYGRDKAKRLKLMEKEKELKIKQDKELIDLIKSSNTQQAQMSTAFMKFVESKSDLKSPKMTKHETMDQNAIIATAKMLINSTKPHLQQKGEKLLEKLADTQLKKMGEDVDIESEDYCSFGD